MESSMKRYREYVKRTAASNEFRKDCERTNDYFKFWDLQTSKQKDWTRPEYYQSRMNKQMETEQSRKREAALDVRRQKLSNMLYEENLALNEELQKKYELNDLNDQQLKQKFDELVALKKEASKEEAKRMSEAKTSVIVNPAELEKDSMKLDELKKIISAEDEARNNQLRRPYINFADASDRLRESEATITSLLSQEAILHKMEQDLFSIEEEKLSKMKNAVDTQVNSKNLRHVVLYLKQRGAQVLREIEQEKALIGKIQKACEQATLNDDSLKEAYQEVNNLVKLIDGQAIREKRVATHSANIFQEEANKELEACEQRWKKEETERHSKISQILSDLQAHARKKREAVTLEMKELESERKVLSELLMHSTAPPEEVAKN